MKMIICLAVLIAVAAAIPVDDSAVATVLRYDNDNVGVEGYKYGYVKLFYCKLYIDDCC